MISAAPELVGAGYEADDVRDAGRHIIEYETEIAADRGT
jgi:hypothetical protein